MFKEKLKEKLINLVEAVIERLKGKKKRARRPASIVKVFVFVSFGIILLAIGIPGTTDTNLDSLHVWFNQTYVPFMAVGITILWVLLNLHNNENFTWEDKYSIIRNIFNLVTIIKRNIPIFIFKVLILTLSTYLAINTVNKRLIVDTQVNYENDAKLTQLYADKQYYLNQQNEAMKQQTAQELIIDKQTNEGWEQGARGGRKRAENTQANITWLKAKLDTLDNQIVERENDLKNSGSASKQSILLTASNIPFLNISDKKALQIATLLMSLINDLMVQFGCILIKRYCPICSWRYYKSVNKRLTDRQRFAKFKAHWDQKKSRNSRKVEKVSNINYGESENSRNVYDIPRVTSKMQRNIKYIITIINKYSYPGQKLIDDDIVDHLEQDYSVELSRNRVCEIRRYFVTPILDGTLTPTFLEESHVN